MSKAIPAAGVRGRIVHSIINDNHHYYSACGVSQGWRVEESIAGCLGKWGLYRRRVLP